MHPHGKIINYTSQMELTNHSDVSFFSAPKPQIYVGVQFPLGNYLFLSNPNTNNRYGLTLAVITKHAMFYEEDVEVANLFINGKEYWLFWTTLSEMGWTQKESTPIATENSMSDGIANDSIQQKRSKVMYMYFYWVCDSVTQKNFYVN